MSTASVDPEVVEIYSRGAEYALSKCRTSAEDGLTSAEAEKRLKESDKKNELEEEEEESLLMKYLSKFKDPMTLLLLCSACISIVMRQYEDAMSIVIAVIIVATVGFVQEYKSEKAVEALKEFVAHRCIVIRDGKTMEIAAKDLVIGDIVDLTPGERVPADMRIFQAANLRCNESLLTGEAESVSKRVEALTPPQSGVNLADRRNMAFMGTTVASGNGRGVVTGIGADAELGKISEMLQEKDKKTPLQMSMDDFGKRLSLFSLIIIVAISFIAFLTGKPPLAMFNMAVSLIVAAIPEGLPIAVTVTLALGVTRMSAKNAIVRKLPAVEALGATNVICVDKTGTLTQNQMTVDQIYTAHLIKVHHEKESLTSGDVTYSNGADIKKDRHLAELLQACVLCNNAHIEDDTLIGQPTEGGLISVAFKSGIPVDLRSTITRVKEVPFDSQTKWMGVEVNINQSPRFYIKGSVEVVLDRCTEAYADGHLNKERILAVYKEMASTPLRVMAVAFGTKGFADNLVFLGLVGLHDPPRRGVREAVNQCKESHVRVVMITGDSRETAYAVARELGIADSETQVMSAQELEAADNESIRQTCVFYRMTPALKVKVVNAFSNKGQSIVAMTGDGVNDAPALSQSDIGIAMGKGGSDVCKEASEIILVDNNFTTIVDAIEEGKIIFDNIKNFLRFQLTTSVAAMLLTAVCSIADLPLPLNPTQILLINIIMDGPPAQSLTFESYRGDVRKPPRDPKASMVDKSMAYKIIVGAVVMVAGTLAVFLAAIPNASPESLRTMNEAPRTASTMAFTTFVLFQIFNAMNCRSFHHSVFTVGLFSNRGLLYSLFGAVVVQLAVIYFAPLQSVFRTTLLSSNSFFLCVAVASSIWLLDEIWKLIKH